MTIDRRQVVRGGAMIGALGLMGGCSQADCQDRREPTVDPVIVTGDTDVGWLLNVAEFGVTPGEEDQSVGFQRAIDAAHASGRTLFVPAGRYTADGLVLRNGSRLLGAGAETSVIHAVPGSSQEAVLQIDRGVLQHVVVEALGLEGADNPGQHGFLARSVRGDEGVSGLWHSSFTHLRIYNFDGAQVWLEGGGVESRDPIQFLEFHNVVLERKPTAPESISLLMSGQVNQTRWSGGRIDAFGAKSEGAPGVNLKICPQLQEYSPSTEQTPYLSPKVGHTHVFSGTTFQQAELAVLIDGAESISFDTCHFEGLGSGILFRGGQGLRVDRCHFANATIANPSNGFCLRAVDSAQVIGHGNMFIGESGHTAETDGSSATIQLSGSQGLAPAVTSGLTRRVQAGPVIDLAGATTAVLTGPGRVSTIVASHYPGTLILLRVTDGDVTFEGGGNLHLGQSTSVMVRAGGTVGLVRFDIGPEWVLSCVVDASSPASSS